VESENKRKAAIEAENKRVYNEKIQSGKRAKVASFAALKAKNL
jgi:peptidylprolyl isomerase